MASAEIPADSSELESIWQRLKSSADESEEAPNAVRKLARLVRAATVRSDLVEGSAVDGATYAGFFGVSAQLPTGEPTVTAEELFEALERAVDQKVGEFSDIDRERFLAGPSYIELGSWLGDQGDAISLIGLGAIFGFWDVASPAIVGIQGDQAQQMMGMGFLFPSLKAASPLLSWKEASA